MPYRNPFALAKLASPELQHAFDYWRNLKRGGNDIPFADDLNLAALKCPQILLLKAYALPQRFRIEFASDGLTVNSVVSGKFIDEIDPQGSLSYLQAQCSATVEGGEPTLCRLIPRSAANLGLSRLLLPTWGNGQIEALIAAIAFDQ